MNQSIPTLFLVPTLIWGSTFFVIKFQLGSVDPGWSVSYRFVLAGLILLCYARWRGLTLSFTKRQHGFIFLQGILLFGLNYLLVYTAEEKLTSALAAIAFSTIIFLNIFFGSLLLNRTSEKKVFLGAFLGIAGTFFLFKNDLEKLAIHDLPYFHLTLCFVSVVVASLGNITSAYNQSKSLPILQTNAFGMLYGGLFTGLIALLLEMPLTFDLHAPYVLSLIYLALFGSIIAFGAYLTLIGKIGADRAAYVLIMLPVIAVALSILFEGYPLTLQAVLGMALIIVGNAIITRKKR